MLAEFCLFVASICHTTLCTHEEKPNMVQAKEKSITELSLQFAKFFTNKDAAGIGTLVTDEFALYDPALKWVKGKKTIVDILSKLFQETKHVSYEVLNTYKDGSTCVLEFKITLDDKILHGVDFMEWKGNKMTELRCYYNPPES